MGQTRTMGHPLVINPETKETYIGNVAFPRVTVAPPGGFKSAQVFDAISNYGRLVYGYPGITNWTYNEALGVFRILDQVCSPNTTFAGLNNIEHEDNINWELGYEDINKSVTDNELQKSERVAPFIRQGMINCSELFERCFLNGRKLDCGEVFKGHFSERGSSCIFNGIPTAATRRNTMLQSALGRQYKADELTEWKHVKSDRDSDSVAEKRQNRTIPIPWKQYFPGKTSGLIFVIKRENDSDKACVHGEGDGLMKQRQLFSCSRLLRHGFCPSPEKELALQLVRSNRFKRRDNFNGDGNLFVGRHQRYCDRYFGLRWAVFYNEPATGWMRGGASSTSFLLLLRGGGNDDQFNPNTQWGRRSSSSFTDYLCPTTTQSTHTAAAGSSSRA
ncbi:uncharacterized protein LOC110861318 isoform X1 [Folsomia candida]|uniref:uncharacterized protein LOC110861318 isoform X1 n=1 Tax=Folsomia candida TaxID=158441 RepID=UPI0016054E27|nr:uncharacterized protein LOC110861318 isoform X1 [Folsomia candida]